MPAPPSNESRSPRPSPPNSFLAEQEAQTVQKQPKPRALKRPHTLFLEDLVDPLAPSPLSKRYRPEAVDSLVTAWVECASAAESYRERHCRSDTLLAYFDGDIIPRRLTKSAPNMESRRDADGFALPPTPAPTKAPLYRANAEDDAQMSWYGPSVARSDVSGASTGSGRKSLVEDPYYRRNNLAENNIYLRPDEEEFPNHIARLISCVRKDRDSPGPSLEQLRQDTDLYALRIGCAEPAVENYFKANVFPNPKSSDSLKRIDKNPMAKCAVPDVGSKLKVSTPYPDMLYGYNSLGAFPQQQAQLRNMANEMVANTQDLIYPFFIIEFKADGPGGSGSLWVATNQCLGGSTSCVNIAESLNRRLRQCESTMVQPINSAAFSIAMNGTEARLYVSWKHNELDYYMKHVDSFLLQKPRDYIEFRKLALNIIDWGKNERLTKIQDILNTLLEESRKAASQRAGSRPPPSSDDSLQSSSYKRKSSSSRGRSRKANTVRDRSSEAPPASFQEDYRHDSSGQVLTADDALPSAKFNPDHQDGPFMSISPEPVEEPREMDHNP